MTKPKLRKIRELHRIRTTRGSESHVCVCLTKFPGFSAEQGEGRGSPGPAVREHTRNRTMASRCHEPGGRGVGERATSQRTEEVY